MSQEQLSIILLVRVVIKLFNIVIIDSVSELQIFMNCEKFNLFFLKPIIKIVI